MENKNIKIKIALIAALVIAIIFGGILINSKSGSDEEVIKEKVKNETLLSEKIKLDKMVDGMKEQLASLTGKNEKLDKIVSTNNDLLKEQEQEIKKLKSEKASIAAFKKKIAELESLQVKLNNEIKESNIALGNLKNENEAQTVAIKSLQTENEKLKTNNEILKALVADNFRIEALRGSKGKLTLNARRTNKLVVSFDLPADIKETLNFKVVAPNGKEYSSKNNPTAYVTITDNKENLVASTETIGMELNAKRAEMTYKPTEKMQAGIYKFNIYNNDDYLGSAQFRLK